MDIKQRQQLMSFAKSQEAENLAAEGKLEEAVAYYSQLIAAEPINFSYREKLANLFIERAMVTEASAQLKAVADIHLSEGRLDLAQEYAGKISLMDPEGLDTLRLFAVLAKRKDDHEGMAKHYGKLSQVAFDAGQYEEAKGAIEAAISAGRTDLRLLLAKTLLALKKPAEAKTQFEALQKENPEDESIVEQLLAVAEETKDWNAAYTYINALIQKHPDDPRLQPRLARTLLQVGKRPEAMQIYLNLATNALKENKVDAAFSYFDSILALEPDNTDVLKKKAEIYLKQNKKQEVIDTYKKLQVIYTQKKMLEEAKKIGLVLTRLAGLK
jgi:tetratricopeptide (TPR) repeat protein